MIRRLKYNEKARWIAPPGLFLNLTIGRWLQRRAPMNDSRNWNRLMKFR